MSVSPQGAGSPYPTYNDLRNRRLAERRNAAIHALRRANALVHEAGGRLIVFGSLVEGGFDERSDIDVALFDIPVEQEPEIETEVELLLSSEGFEVDIVRGRSAGPSLRDRIMTNGRDAGTLV